jgi:hypothetical protein
MGTRQRTKNAQASQGEKENEIEPRMSIDEMAKKYAELQGQSCLCTHKLPYNYIFYHEDALEREKAENASLRDKLEDTNENQGVGNNSKPTASETILRPAGTAGTNFSIQIAMGLSGSSKKDDKYKAIQVMSCRHGADIYSPW